METNRMIKHSLIEPAYLGTSLGDYPIGPIVRSEFLTTGLNDTYVICTKQRKYIYRLYRHGWRNEEAIHFELDAINHLSALGYQASYPIAKRDGSYLTEIVAPEGPRYGVLFTCADGERPIINAESAELIGASLGRLHQQTKGFHSEHNRGFQLDLQHLLDEPADHIAPIIQQYLGKESTNAFENIVKYIKDELGKKELEVGFCHGDFHNHNMHLNQQEIEVFDFDCCAIGYRSYDVAVSWWNLISHYKKVEAECWEAFLRGYSAQRNLATDDRDSLPLFITARRIWLLGTMLQNDDVWGTNWINAKSLELFMLQIRTDHLKNK